MASKIVSNTGSLRHLSEISMFKCLGVFKEISIPEEVSNELKRQKIRIPNRVKLVKLSSRSKDVSEIFTSKFSIDLGESQAIALVLQEKARYFLTDDLDARTVANFHHIEVHGTVGILLRAFREKIINKETAIRKVNELYSDSSLFITKDLVDYVIREIKGFR